MAERATFEPWWTSHDASMYLGDSLTIMRSWPKEAAFSIVTSPEYADQRRYAHGANTAPEAFADAFEPFLVEMLRVVSSHGSLMLNLGVILRHGEETSYADDVLARARAVGWKLLHRTLWHKPNPLPMSHPAYLTIAHEWVFWLAKDVDAYRGYDTETRSPHAETSKQRITSPYLTTKDSEKYGRRSANNSLHADGARPTTVFTCAVGSTRGIKHPAPMPLDLARYLISLSTPPGELVLDPFCGSGTTLVAARERGRRSIGIDRNEEYLTEAASRLAQEVLAL